MCQGLNSHYFHTIGDKLINPIVGVYIPIIRIPSLKVGGLPSPTKRDNLDHGRCENLRDCKIPFEIRWFPAQTKFPMFRSTKWTKKLAMCRATKHLNMAGFDKHKRALLSYMIIYA